MSINNYSDLRSEVSSYLNRSDLASYIPDFIRLAERRISYGSDAPYSSVPVRVPAMQNRASGTITNSSIAFPTGFLEVIRLAFTSGSTSWNGEFADFTTFTNLENSGVVNADFSTQPTAYQFLNNAIVTAGQGPAGYTLDYYKAFDALTADVDTNWLLTNSPDVYLFGALIESAPFLMDKESQMLLPAWWGMYKSSVSALNRTSQKPAGGSMRVRAN